MLYERYGVVQLPSASTGLIAAASPPVEVSLAGVASFISPAESFPATGTRGLLVEILTDILPSFEKILPVALLILDGNSSVKRIGCTQARIGCYTQGSVWMYTQVSLFMYTG